VWAPLRIVGSPGVLSAHCAYSDVCATRLATSYWSRDQPAYSTCSMRFGFYFHSFRVEWITLDGCPSGPTGELVSGVGSLTTSKRQLSGESPLSPPSQSRTTSPADSKGVSEPHMRHHAGS